MSSWFGRSASGRAVAAGLAAACAGLAPMRADDDGAGETLGREADAAGLLGGEAQRAAEPPPPRGYVVYATGGGVSAAPYLAPGVETYVVTGSHIPAETAGSDALGCARGGCVVVIEASPDPLSPEPPSRERGRRGRPPR